MTRRRKNKNGKHTVDEMISRVIAMSLNQNQNDCFFSVEAWSDLSDGEDSAAELGKDRFRFMMEPMNVWTEFPMSGDTIRALCNNGICRADSSSAIDVALRYMQGQLLRSCFRYKSLLTASMSVDSDVFCLFFGYVEKQFDSFIKEEMSIISYRRGTRETIINRIVGVVSKIQRSRRFAALQIKLEPFGSHSSELDDCEADIDLSVRGKGRKKDSNAFSELQHFSHEERGGILQCMKSHLSKHGFSVIPIVKARIPLIKVRDQEKKISCDIVFACDNTEGIHKSLALRCIKILDDRFHHVLLLVKSWASHWKLRDASLNRLNSYALTQLVIFHLQTRPVPILPPLRDLMRVPWEKKHDGMVSEFNWYTSKRLMEQPYAQRQYMIDIMEQNCISLQMHRSTRECARGQENKETLTELMLSFFVFIHGLFSGWEGPKKEKNTSGIQRNIRISTFHRCIYVGEHPQGVMTNAAGNGSPIFIEDPFDSKDNCARSLSKDSIHRVRQAAEKTLRSFEEAKERAVTEFEKGERVANCCTNSSSVASGGILYLWYALQPVEEDVDLNRTDLVRLKCSFMVTEAYSLWFMPPAGSLQRVQETIQQLSSRYKSTVAFPAHMTLVGGIKMSESTVRRISEELVQSLEPVDVHITRVGYSSTYHQCVFLRVELTQELVEQHALAQKKFSMDEHVEYMPHISLLYSNIDLTERQKLVEEQQERHCGGGGGEDMGRLQCDRVELWYTPPEDLSLGSWRRLESYSIMKK